MEASNNLIDFIKNWEGLYLYAYDDSLGIWTIGYGTIKYPNGVRVKKGDVCTIDDAIEWLKYEVQEKAKAVNDLIEGAVINQSQFDALVSFAYNLGIGGLKMSTLLKKLKIYQYDKTIYKYKIDEHNNPIADSCEFCKWCRGGGEIMNGLLKRRAAEADMYSKFLIN